MTVTARSSAQSGAHVLDSTPVAAVRHVRVMRRLFTTCLLLGCATTAPATQRERPPATETTPAVEAESQPTPAETMSVDTAKATTEGAQFIAPAGWVFQRRGAMTVLTPPEGDSHIALIDVPVKNAPGADAAVAAAWALYKPDFKWSLELVTPAPDHDGWSMIREYEYRTSPNERRDVSVGTQLAHEVWTVVIYDMRQDVSEKRLGAVSSIFGRLLPKGYSRESFAGKTANPLDAPRIAQLTNWVQKAMKALEVPGVSLGIVQNGQVVLADGFGVRELGKQARPDADTLFMIASNTKALTTLMLGKLVEEQKLSWDTPVKAALPTFELGDDEITSQVEVRHLVCACTGLPRQDYEWLFEYGHMTPDGAMKTLADVKPTSKFGEMFQYSNLLAGAAGFVGGHVLFPTLELGAAYDRAMKTRVFEPLGMRATTFDYAKALAGNHASAHAPDIEGTPSKALMAVNYSIIPLRPAGAAWSSVRDLLAYVQMELAEGVLPSGKRYIAKEPLLERRVMQVSIGKDDTYGMGLVVRTKYGTPVVHHGGDMIGFHSDMMWLPEHNVGAVVLTNSDPGWVLRSLFQRKLLEVLFDGRPEADDQVEAEAKTFFDQIAADRKLLSVPADAAEAAKLAARYENGALGSILVRHDGPSTRFDFGEWQSDVATKTNPDGTVSFVTTVPGMTGFELTVGTSHGKRALIARDMQHEYVFEEHSAS
jgi:CubicO group peptidase (beta-lactamase class C family)